MSEPPIRRRAAPASPSGPEPSHDVERKESDRGRAGPPRPDEDARRQGQAETAEAARSEGRTRAPLGPVRAGDAAPRDPQPAKTERNRPADPEDKKVDKNLDKALEGSFPASDPVDLTPKGEPVKPAPIERDPRQGRKAEEEQAEAARRAERRGAKPEDMAG